MIRAYKLPSRVLLLYSLTPQVLFCTSKHVVILLLPPSVLHHPIIAFWSPSACFVFFSFLFFLSFPTRLVSYLLLLSFLLSGNVILPHSSLLMYASGSRIMLMASSKSSNSRIASPGICHDGSILSSQAVTKRLCATRQIRLAH